MRQGVYTAKRPCVEEVYMYIPRNQEVRSRGKERIPAPACEECKMSRVCRSNIARHGRKE
ncbi:MAG: hypothetical protein IJG36_09665 [Synergistaceae bacterium]|nr:hypothetical protein [Synergistaceae bacterium]